MTPELDEVVDVARQLIAAPSENPPGDEREVADVASRLLRERGVDAVTTRAVESHRPNVVASVESTRPGPTVILSGHIDTKPVGSLEEWEHDPFAGVIADGRLYGLGACDMKGGVAAVIVALGRIRAAGGPPCGSVVGLLLGDEEAGSTCGGRFLAEAGEIEGDAAIIAEPAGVTRDWERFYLGTRGSILFRVDLTGATGHSSLEDHLPGTSATLALARLVDRLDAAFHELPGVAVNVAATVEGGIYYAVRAGHASFRGDVRIPPEVTLEGARSVLEQTTAEFLSEHPGVGAAIVTDELLSGGAEALWVEADSPIASACRAAAETALGSAPPDGIYPAGTDSFFIQGIAGVPTIPALGPGRLQQAHQPNEFVSLESLEAAPGLLTVAVENYFAAEGSS